MSKTRSSKLKQLSCEKQSKNEISSPSLATEPEEKVANTSGKNEPITELILSDLEHEASENDEEFEKVDEETYFREAFQVFDKNKDGFICKEDLKALFSSMNEDHSDSAISKMIGKFNQDENKNEFIPYSNFKEILFPKISNPYSQFELSNAFRKVREITDGIQILDTENITQNEVIEFDGILEALDTNLISGIGSLGKAELRVIISEIESGGTTYGVTLPEFSDLMEDYATNINVMFGALLLGDHQDEHQCDCENDTDDGIIVLNADGSLSTAHLQQETSSPVLEEVKNSKKRLLQKADEFLHVESIMQDEIINATISVPVENDTIPQKVTKIEFE